MSSILHTATANISDGKAERVGPGGESLCIYVKHPLLNLVDCMPPRSHPQGPDSTILLLPYFVIT